MVLDEGHFIKNHETKQSAAAASLDARARWIVSGTPIQNSMRDLYGLVAFLHLKPLSERPVFRATFERPMAIGDKAALLRLKLLMAAVALRRLKTTVVRGQPLVALPPKIIEFVDVELEGEHRGLYDKWERAGREAIVSHLESDTLLRNYSSVLEIILRCDASLPSALCASGFGTTQDGKSRGRARVCTNFPARRGSTKRLARTCAGYGRSATTRRCARRSRQPFSATPPRQAAAPPTSPSRPRSARSSYNASWT